MEETGVSREIHPTAPRPTEHSGWLLYVKRGVFVSKRLICEHGEFICICSNKETESDQNYWWRNQDIIMVYEAVIKVDIYGVGLANTRTQL